MRPATIQTTTHAIIHPPPEGHARLVVRQRDDAREQMSAQIVWTVSEIPGINGVRFLRDGVEIAALDAEGTEQEGAVSIADYRSLVP